MTIDQETGQQEKRKRLEAMWWAGVFIWAGLIFGADSLGFLPQIGGASAWSWVFAGAGLYALVGALWRVASPDQPNPTAWDYTWAGILLIIGLLLQLGDRLSADPGADWRGYPGQHVIAPRIAPTSPQRIAWAEAEVRAGQCAAA
jgi:hypothetical protein